MTVLQALTTLVSRLDAGVGQAWAYTEADLQRELDARRSWNRGATYVRYAAAFASLGVVALWRHETQRAGVAAWREAILHASRVGGQGFGLMTMVGVASRFAD